MIQMFLLSAMLLTPIKAVQIDEGCNVSTTISAMACEPFCEELEGYEIPVTTLPMPSKSDVEIMAKVIHGEAGICSDLQKSAVAWCVLNRVDWFEYPNTIAEVIKQPHQFKGYSPDKKPTEDDYRIAWDVIFRWMNDLEGRTLPREFLFFHADKKGKNVFTTNHKKGRTWDWSLPDPYEIR